MRFAKLLPLRMLVPLVAALPGLAQQVRDRAPNAHLSSESPHPKVDPAKAEELNRLASAVSPSIPVESTQRITINNYIDEVIFGKIQSDHIPHAELCSDAEFARRVSLDLTGRLPEPQKVRDFVKDADPKKREKLVDSLMATSTRGVTVKPTTPFLDRWTYFFSDVFSVGNLNGPGKTLAHHYLYNFLITNQP